MSGAPERPADENPIEVTPEMIEAGAAVLWNFDVPEPLWLSPSSAEEYAEKIIRAALAARQSKTPAAD